MMTRLCLSTGPAGSVHQAEAIHETNGRDLLWDEHDGALEVPKLAGPDSG